MSVDFTRDWRGRVALHMYLKKEAELLNKKYEYKKERTPIVPKEWYEEKKSAYIRAYRYEVDRIIKTKVEDELCDYKYTRKERIGGFSSFISGELKRFLKRIK